MDSGFSRNLIKDFPAFRALRNTFLLLSNLPIILLLEQPEQTKIIPFLMLRKFLSGFGFLILLP